MAKAKSVLTTGDVAKICSVAPRTVSKWFDSGQLKGYRIPGSKDRRIPLSELLRFMRLNNIPTDAIANGSIRVLIVDSNGTGASLADSLSSKAGYEVQTVQSNFQAGMAAQKFSPHVLLVNLMSPGIAAIDICGSIRANEDLQTIKIVAITNRLTDSEAAALLGKGFDGYVTSSSDVSNVIDRIEEMTAIVY